MTAALPTGGYLCPNPPLAMTTGGYLCQPVGGIVGVSVVIDLIGIVEDGGPPSSRVPPNPRRPVRVIFGDAVTMNLAVLNRSGTEVDLDNTTIALSVRRTPTGADAISKQATRQLSLGKNKAQIVVVPDDYRRLFQAGEELIYDIILTNGAGRVAIVPLSRWTIEATATPLA